MALQRSADASIPVIRLSSEDRLRIAAGAVLPGAAGRWSVGIVLGEALVVESVSVNSSADVLGVRKGDTLLSVDSMRVTGGLPSNVAALLTSRHCGASLHLLLTRPLPASEEEDMPVLGGGEGWAGANKIQLVAVEVCCTEPPESKGGEDKGGGETGFTTKQTLKAVTGLFKGFFK